MLLTCQSGYESLLVRELADAGGVAAQQGPGWVRVASVGAGEAGGANPNGSAAGPAVPPYRSLAFPHLTLLGTSEIAGGSVNALAQAAGEFLLASLRGVRVEAAWPSIWMGPHETVGLGRRVAAVEEAFQEILKKKLSRVAKLATPDLPRGSGAREGLFVYFTDFGRAVVARQAFAHGPRRMADDPDAPSRSYLKVEEAYVVLGREPAPGETVVDLGAAPGGWSFSAAKHGAQVIAVDNGPLKGGALDHPRIEHRREDAFGFLSPGRAGPPARPVPGWEAAGPEAQPYPPTMDWLFCDMLEEPHRIVRDIVEPWLASGACRRFVVNLKFGRVDPIALLRELRAEGSPLVRHATNVRIVHLYHDREEFTVVGETKP